MKSKEEFEKSVFAKRDALLKKRRNTVITTVSLGCTALCLTVAASAYKPVKTVQPGGTGETEIYYNGALPVDETSEDLLYVEDNGAPETPKTTVAVGAEGFRETSTKKCDIITHKYFGYSPEKPEIEKTENEEALTNTEIYRETVASTKKKNPLAGETALAPEIGGEPATYTYPDGYTEPYIVGGTQVSEPHMPEKKYPSNEEIVAAALSYLTDSEKALIIDDTPSIAMTHYTDKTKGDEYDVHFRTLTGKIKVVLLVDTLELVEKK